jgi:hypothetical protein
VIPGSKHDGRLSPNQKHGLKVLKRAVKQLGSHAIDRRTLQGRALAALRAELIADLGGIENVSTAQLALIEEALVTKFLLSSINAWMLAQPTLVSGKRRGVLPVVLHRNALVATLRQLLTDLGLERRHRDVPVLEEYLKQKADEQKSTPARSDSTHTGDTGDTSFSSSATPPNVDISSTGIVRAIAAERIFLQRTQGTAAASPGPSTAKQRQDDA